MSKFIPGSDVRRQFIQFFVEKCGHTYVPSSPVIPVGDNTLMFANAGMNQFKPIFLGAEKREYTRAANTQKCIRAGGKHNDLDDVGKDTYHHTFFEMLGNWSFGDYFKQEAVDWSWELLTKVWGLDPERLHATYFEGDAAQGLEEDLETRALWLKHLPAERIHKGNKKDNFWEMGDTGPCGPCTEIHYNGLSNKDGSVDKSGAQFVNASNPDVIEIWNNVFIQFNRNQDGSLSQLPAKHVDTGMGLERITRILQGKNSNYDSDLFTPIFAAIQQVTGAPAYTGILVDNKDIAYRVIADHIRTLSFALSDGAHCGNSGREYVLRSILRRAVRYGHQNLGATEPFFHKLVQAVVDNFGAFFPELKAKQAQVEAELKEEEISFRKTLERGIVLFEEAAKAAKGTVIGGQDAFKLHDTYGFPIGLTQLMAQERGMTVDEKGFEAAMEAARELSRGEKGGADAVKSLNDLTQQLGLKATDFTGYAGVEFGPAAQTAQVFVLSAEGVYRQAAEAKAGDAVAVVLETTPFYGESGGQVGDTGVLLIGGARIRVADTQRVGDVYFHLGQVQGGVVKSGQAQVAAVVDKDRRSKIVANHTLTHVMNRALRDCVNADTHQKGSRVDDERTRFDFSNPGALTPEQVAAVEAQVNADIAKNLKVDWQVVPQEEALKIAGLRAVFGEKYPPMVRVVSIGATVEDLLNDPTNPKWVAQSTEFCGGVHLKSLGEAQAFVLISEEAVAKGVRRVTALTGEAAKAARAQGAQLVAEVAAAQKLTDAAAIKAAAARATESLGNPGIPLSAKAQLREGAALLQEKVKELDKAAAREAAGKAVEQAREIAESATGAFIVAHLPGAGGEGLRAAMDVLRKSKPECAVLLIGDGEGRVGLSAAVPAELIAKGLKAGEWVNAAAAPVGGKGGGKPDAAQAGGKDAAQIPAAVAAAHAFAAGKL